jgi:hypothetical protein
VVIPESTLTADGTYSATLGFSVFGNIDTTSYPGATGYTYLLMQTSFNLQTTNPPGVFPIATNPALVEFSDGIAFDGTNYLVGMLAGTNISAQFFSSNGTLIGPLVTIGQSLGFPRLAFGGSNYLAAWEDDFDSGENLFGQIISRNGTMAGPAFSLGPGGSSCGIGRHEFPGDIARQRQCLIWPIGDFGRGVVRPAILNQRPAKQ